MGRNDLLTAEEAAEILGVKSHRGFRNLVRQGYLIALFPEGPKGPEMFSLDHVAALKDARSRNIDMPTIYRMAQVAHAVSRTTMQRVQELEAYLGLNVPIADTSEEAVLSLYFKVQDLLEGEKVRLDHTEAMRWYRDLSSIDEGYLELVEAYTGDKEPWMKFFLLAKKLLDDMPIKEREADRSLHVAYGFLEAARRHIRHVSYMYSRLKNGKRETDRLFPEGDVDEEVIAHAFPD